MPRSDARRLLAAGGAALFAVQAIPVAAQSDARSTVGGVTEAQLEEIIVTARSIETTLPIELSEYGNDVEFVTEAQIRNHGFVDVTQALEMLVPGMLVTTQAGAFSYVNLSMQGSRTSDVLWTVDGVRISNRLYNGTSPADTLPASMVERIEVLKGGQGLLYGTQAVAGVINVVTRSFSDAPSGSINVGSDSNGGLHASGYVRGALGDHNLVAWASKDRTDGYEIYDVYQPSTTSRKRAYDVGSFGLKYGYDFTDNLRLAVQGIHTEATLDYPSVRGNSVNDRNEEIIRARLDYTPSDRAQLFVKSYYHDWDTDYFTVPNPSAYWGYDDFGIGAGANIESQHGLEYHVGFDFQSYEGLDEELEIAGQEEQVRALYGQIRTTEDLFDKTRLAAGLRHNEAGGSSATVGSISGVHHFNDYLYLEGVFGTSFMLPSAYNLYRTECCTFGNPTLEAEESVGLNLAIGGRLDVGDRPLSWQVTGWDRRVDNLITTAAITGDAPIVVPPEYDRIFVNIDEEVKVTGAEFLLRGPITQALQFSVSYTYSKEVDPDSGTQLSGRPRHHSKASLSYEPPGLPFGLNLAVKHVGDTTTDVRDFGDQQFGDYYVANLGAHVYLDGEGGNHRLNLRLENAFDETYATSLGSALLETSDTMRFMYRRLGPPRTMHVSYNYAF